MNIFAEIMRKGTMKTEVAFGVMAQNLNRKKWEIVKRKYSYQQGCKRSQKDLQAKFSRP